MTQQGRVSWVAAVGWAFYVAVSWTWVIGMFLPVLLVRDFGGWGWVAFAVPNAVGAMSVGFVMRTPRQSAEFTVTRLRGVVLFTAITLALQVVAFGWVVGRVAGTGPALILTAGVAALPAGLLRVRSTGGAIWPLLAVLTWLVSATVAGVLLVTRQLDLPDFSTPATGGDALALAGLAAACGLGFLLCPYLDVTLQAARQAAAGRSRLAFGLGFGLLFPAMIALTLGYATLLPGLMRGRFEGTLAGVAMLLQIHLFAQVMFTNTAHLTALRRLCAAIDAPQSLRPTPSWAFPLLILGGIGVLLARVEPAGLTLFDYAPGEVAYRGLLTFFGLVFPAYLLLGAGWRLWLGLLLATPAFAAAFFGGQMAWALAGVGALLLIRLLNGPHPHGA